MKTYEIAHVAGAETCRMIDSKQVQRRYRGTEAQMQIQTSIDATTQTEQGTETGALML